MGLLWIFSHIFYVFLPERKYSKLVAIAILSLIVLIIALKPATYDLPGYLQAFSRPGTFLASKEIVFELFNVALKWIGLSPYQVYLLYMTMTTMLILLAVRRFLEKQDAETVIILSVVLGSVYFILATQNGIRNGFALSALLYGLSLWKDRRWLFAFIFFLVGCTFHYSAIVSLFFVIGMHVLINLRQFFMRKTILLDSSIYPKLDEMLRRTIAIVLILIVAVIGLVLAKTILATTNYSNYLEKSVGDGRTSGLIKFIAVGTVLVFSSFFHREDTESKHFRIIDYMFQFRYLMFCFLAPFAFFSELEELYARLLFNYYLVELVFITVVFHGSNKWNRQIAVLILLSYGIAPNAINIIGGLF